MTNLLYGYWIEETKIWSSHGNGRYESNAFKTLDEAKKSSKSRYDDICSSDNYFVGDFGLYEYEVDAPPGQYTQIYRIRT